MSQRAGLGATPARRSARLSQAGSVTNQSIITTVTTGGTRQRKKAPLTKVKARKSNAYGASGRVSAAEELSLSNTGFAQAFQNQRGDAVARDDDDEEDDDIDELGAETPRMSGALNGRAVQQSSSPDPELPTPAAPGLSFEDSEDAAPSESGLAASIDQTSKSFGPVHEAGMLFRRLRQDSSRAPSEERYAEPLWKQNRARRMQARADVQEQEEEVEIVVETTARQRSNQAALAEKAVLDQSIDDLLVEEQARLQREGPPQPRVRPQKPARTQQLNSPEAINAWLGNVPGIGHDQPKWSLKRLGMLLLWAFVAYSLIMSTASYFMSSDYPESIARTPSVGSALVSRAFYSWRKLAEVIQPGLTRKEEFDLFKAGDDNIMWNRLFKLNKKFDARFDDIHSTINGLKNDLPDFMIMRRNQDGKREITDDFWQALISKARAKENDSEWTDFLKSNEQKLRDLFGAPVDISTSDHWPEAVSRQEFVDAMDRHYKTLAAQVDERVVAAMRKQHSELKAMAHAEARKTVVDSIRLESLAMGNLLANYELNLRKPNYFSSGLGALVIPTLTSATFLDNPRPLAKIARRLTLVPQRNPPKAALDKWEEPGDCWCAAPSPAMNGQAQLTVALPRPMYPRQVTIEHLPMSMMPGKKITNAPRLVELWVETDQDAQYHYAHRQGTCQEGPAGWTCLGAFAYNIHASNYQQTFDLDGQTPVPATKAMLRVTSNWGADHTCLYRVRLHGEDALEDHAYTIRLNDPAR
ncbi:hypothetical protein EK21DRAFT_98769 [Setomelanomma holmii]|uniref:SUN domain-containing protein n=1 Tax=Setomelanomma holmii TaxID=210430 RepID=A0A9P4HG38_9PLEO|nr:hypothetical protein EK21DRAFT_98769 [Setomelanomma holmii]